MHCNITWNKRDLRTECLMECSIMTSVNYPLFQLQCFPLQTNIFLGWEMIAWFMIIKSKNTFSCSFHTFLNRNTHQNCSILPTHYWLGHVRQRFSTPRNLSFALLSVHCLQSLRCLSHGILSQPSTTHSSAQSSQLFSTLCVVPATSCVQGSLSKADSLSVITDQFLNRLNESVYIRL